MADLYQIWQNYSTAPLVFSDGSFWRYVSNEGWVSCSEDELSRVFVRHCMAQQISVTDVSFRNYRRLWQGLFAVDARTPGPCLLSVDGADLQASPAPDWIATRNGALNIRTLEHSPDVRETLFLPGMVPCGYDPAAACPRWLQFVGESVLPEDVETLQMLFGLSLTYDRSYNVFFLLSGEGGTGKSTAMEVLETLNRGSVCSVSLADMGERFQNYDLTTTRLNSLKDMDRVFETGNVSKREAILKSLTCGEMAQVERKHAHPVTRRFTALCVFGCNQLPRFSDRSQAIFDRMRIIRFPNRFRGTDKQDAQLGNKLKNELPGILNWAIQGYQKLEPLNLFPESPAAVQLKREAIKASRPEELFFEAHLEVCGLGVKTRTVYSAYGEWCIQNGYKPQAENSFSELLLRYYGESGVTKERQQLKGDRGFYYIGLRLVDCPEYQQVNPLPF